MGVVSLVAAMFSLGGLIFVLLESLKSQIGWLTGGRVFAASLVLGLTLGTVLAYAGLPGLGVELLPGLPLLGAGGLIGLLSGLIAPGLDGAMKRWKSLGSECAPSSTTEVIVQTPSVPPAPPPPAHHGGQDTLPDAAGREYGRP